MTEFLKIAISPGVLPLTLLFIPMGLFWLSSMIGAIDLDFFDFSGDGGFDSGDSIEITGGSLRWLARFIGSEYAPIPATLSIFLVFEWGAVMLGHMHWIQDATWKQSFMIAGAGLVPALVCTKLTTMALRPYFRGLRGLEGQAVPIIGRIGKVRSRVCDSASGQVEVDDRESPLLINAHLATDAEPLVRGDTVVVVSQDENRDTYLVKLKTQST